MTVDGTTGTVTSIRDKELGRELVDPQAGFGMGEPFARGVADGGIERARPVAPPTHRRGPVSASLLVRASLRGSPELLGEIVLHRGVKRIEFHYRLLRDLGQTHAYFVAFPFQVPRPRFSFDTGLNVIRPIADQIPGTTTDYYAQRTWVGVEEGDGAWGIAWSAREAPLVQLGGNWPDYVSPAHHGVRPHGFVHEFLRRPEELTLGHVYSYLATNNFRTNFAIAQPGPIHTSYALSSGSTSREGWTARRLGEDFSSPLESALAHGPQAGPLPAAQGFCRLDPPSIHLVTVKRAEDGEGTIVRLLETEGRETEVTVELPFLSFTHAFLANVVEEGRTPLAVAGTRFVVRVGPWRLATIRLQ